MEEDVIVG